VCVCVCTCIARECFDVQNVPCVCARARAYACVCVCVCAGGTRNKVGVYDPRQGTEACRGGSYQVAEPSSLNFSSYSPRP